MHSINSLPATSRLVLFIFIMLSLVALLGALFFVIISKRKKYVLFYLISTLIAISIYAVSYTPIYNGISVDVYQYFSLINILPIVFGIYLFIKQKNILVLFDVFFFAFNITFLECLIPFYGYIVMGLYLYIFIRSIMMLFKAYKDTINYPGIYSIKYTLDYLSVGVIYSNPFHQITYINQAFVEILDTLSLSQYEKTNALLNKLKGFISRTINNNEFVIKINDSYYRIIHDNNISQITCFNITKEEILINEIKEKQNTLSIINKQLKEELEQIEKAQENKALLSIKGYIHDSLAQKLSLVHSFLINESSNNLKEIKKVLSELDLFNEQYQQDDLYYLKNLLKEIGINLNITGQIELYPIDIQSLYLKAIKECTTNAISHGNAHQIDVEIKNDSLTIKNDGDIPINLKYGNGLNNLSLIAESHQYQLLIKIDKAFIVSLIKN